MQRSNDSALYMALTCLDTSIPTKARREFRSRGHCEGIVPDPRRVIDRIEDHGRWDLFKEARFKRWSAGRRAIMVDATMLRKRKEQWTNLGQGGGFAMLGAFSLAAAVDENRDIPTYPLPRCAGNLRGCIGMALTP